MNIDPRQETLVITKEVLRRNYENIQNADPDIIYQGLLELLRELKAPNFSFFDQERNIINAVIERAKIAGKGAGGRTSTLAINCLTNIFQISLSSETLRTVVQSFIAKLLSATPETNETGTKLLSIVLENWPVARGNEIVNLLQKDLINGSRSNDTQLHCLELLKIVSQRFGNLSAIDLISLVNLLKDVIKTPQLQIKKKTSDVIVALSPHFTDANLADIVNDNINSIRSSPNTPDANLRLVTLCNISVNVGSKIIPHAGVLIELITQAIPKLQLDAQNGKVQYSCIEGLNSILRVIPQREGEKGNQYDKILVAVLSALRYDTVYDQEVEEEEKEVENANEDEEEVDAEDEEEEEDEEEDEGAAEDDNDTDDTSWRVRREAARALQTFIIRELITLPKIYETIFPALISRTKNEHTDSTLQELIASISLVVRNTQEYSQVEKEDCTNLLIKEIRSKVIIYKGKDGKKVTKRVEGRLLRKLASQLHCYNRATRTSILSLLGHLSFAVARIGGYKGANLKLLLNNCSYPFYYDAEVIKASKQGQGGGAANAVISEYSQAAFGLLWQVLRSTSPQIVDQHVGSLTLLIRSTALSKNPSISGPAVRSVGELLRHTIPPNENGLIADKKRAEKLWDLCNETFTRPDCDLSVKQNALISLGVVTAVCGKVAIGLNRVTGAVETILKRIDSDSTRIQAARALTAILASDEAVDAIKEVFPKKEKGDKGDKGSANNIFDNIVTQLAGCVRRRNLRPLGQLGLIGLSLAFEKFGDKLNKDGLEVLVRDFDLLFAETDATYTIDALNTLTDLLQANSSAKQVIGDTIKHRLDGIIANPNLLPTRSAAPAIANLLLQLIAAGESFELHAKALLSLSTSNRTTDIICLQNTARAFALLLIGAEQLQVSTSQHHHKHKQMDKDTEATTKPLIEDFQSKQQVILRPLLSALEKASNQGISSSISPDVKPTQSQSKLDPKRPELSPPPPPQSGSVLKGEGNQRGFPTDVVFSLFTFGALGELKDISVDFKQLIGQIEKLLQFCKDAVSGTSMSDVGVYAARCYGSLAFGAQDRLVDSLIKKASTAGRLQTQYLLAVSEYLILVGEKEREAVGQQGSSSVGSGDPSRGTGLDLQMNQLLELLVEQLKSPDESAREASVDSLGRLCRMMPDKVVPLLSAVIGAGGSKKTSSSKISRTGSFQVASAATSNAVSRASAVAALRCAICAENVEVEDVEENPNRIDNIKDLRTNSRSPSPAPLQLKDQSKMKKSISPANTPTPQGYIQDLNFDRVLSTNLSSFFSLIRDPDINVKREVAVLIKMSAMHRPHLTRFALKPYFINLLELLKVNETLRRTEKITTQLVVTDLGKPLRYASYEAVERVVERTPSLVIDPDILLARLVDGFNDDSDVKRRAFAILGQLVKQQTQQRGGNAGATGQLITNSIIEFLPQLLGKLAEQISQQPKPTDDEDDVRQREEGIRGALLVVLELEKEEKIKLSQTFVASIQPLLADREIREKYEILRREHANDV